MSFSYSTSAQERESTLPKHETVFDRQCHHVQRVQLFSGLEQSEMTKIAAAARNLRKRAESSSTCPVTRPTSSTS